MVAPWKKDMTNLDSILKIRDIILLTKVCLVKAMVFPEVMYGRESWTMKKAEHQRVVVLEKTVESPLDCKELKPVNPEINHSWIFIGRTDAEAEIPILWPSDAKNWLIRKDPDSGKDWRQEQWMTENEIVGWHHRFNGHEFEQAPGVVVDREAWNAAVLGVTKSWTRLSNCTELVKWVEHYVINFAVMPCDKCYNEAYRSTVVKLL